MKDNGGFYVVVVVLMCLMNDVASAQPLFVLGDSSVDCGDNTLFYPYFHGNLSLLPCNGSDSSLLPQLLGTFSTFNRFSFLHVNLPMNFM